MTVFVDFLTHVIAKPYSVGATLSTALQLALHALHIQHSATRIFAENLEPASTLPEYIVAIVDIWLPVFVQFEFSDFPIMVSYWFFGILTIALFPEEAMEELGLA